MNRAWTSIRGLAIACATFAMLGASASTADAKCPIARYRFTVQVVSAVDRQPLAGASVAGFANDDDLEFRRLPGMPRLTETPPDGRFEADYAMSTYSGMSFLGGDQCRAKIRTVEILVSRSGHQARRLRLTGRALAIRPGASDNTHEVELPVVTLKPLKEEPARTPAPQDVATIDASVDRLFAAWQTPGSPGCSVGVSRGGVTVLERGYGTAHVEQGVPITPASVFHVASVTKPFTAMSIHLLARDGKLSLDDDVRRHLPEWAGPAGVTIRHLLAHTGGLRDAFLLIELAAPETGRSTHDQLVDLLTRQRELSDPPGRRYAYTNGGYVLLAEIVKRTSGRSLRAFADERIFRPLGMRHTHIHDDTGEIVPVLATGYTRDGTGELRVARLPGGVVGNAGLFTTSGDLLRWQRNFVAPIVGDAALIATMETLPSLPAGEKTIFALGLQVERYGGRRTVGHSGGDLGASAYAVRYPDDDLAVAVLCNLDEIDSIGLARSVADLYLGVGPADATSTAALPATSPATPPATATVSATALAANEGLYRDPTDDTLLRIFLHDGALRGSPGTGADGGWPIVPLGSDRFQIPGTAIILEFASGAGGTARTLRIVGERPTPAILERVASYTPAAPVLAALAGDYRSDELSTTYSLRVTDGALTIQIPGRTPIALQPIAPGTFAGSLVGAIRFVHDRRGTATGFTVQAFAARGVRFARVPPVTH